MDYDYDISNLIFQVTIVFLLIILLIHSCCCREGCREEETVRRDLNLQEKEPARPARAYVKTVRFNTEESRSLPHYYNEAHGSLPPLPDDVSRYSRISPSAPEYEEEEESREEFLTGEEETNSPNNRTNIDHQSDVNEVLIERISKIEKRLKQARM